MNSKPHYYSTLLLAAILAGSTLPSIADVFAVNEFADDLPDTNSNGNPFDFENVPYTIQFDADATADKLIVTLSSEGGNTATITYDGNALTEIPSTTNGRNRGIWYLDLDGTGYAGGDADLTFDLTANATVNGIGFGVLSVDGAAPGVDAGNVASGLEVTLDVSADDSLIVTNHGNNGGTPTVPASHFELYSGDIGSAQGASSYIDFVAAGMQTVTYTGSPSSPATSAAAFSPMTGAPVLLSLNPADNAVDVAADANLVATFNEAVVAGSSGNVELWEVGGGSAVESFPVTSSSRLTFGGAGGADLTIDPTSDLNPNTEYYVLIGDTAVENTGGTSFAGISDPTAWSFTVAGPPLLASTNPADDATNVRVTANLVATFNEPVVAGTGTIELWQVGGGTALESFDVNLSSQLDFTGSVLTIDPTNDLAPGTEYYIVIGATAVEDATGNAFAGLGAPPATPNWSFTTDGTPPTIDTLDPADNAVGLALSVNLTATFNEPVAAGTGTIELWETGGGAPVESFNVTSSSLLTFAGSDLTIDPTNELTSGTEYYVLIGPTAVEDLSGNAFAGISDTSAWSFTAAPAAGSAMVIVNTDSQVVRSSSPNVLSFDAGASADLLVVAFSSEKSSEPYSISYNGVDLTLAVAGSAGSTADIWYLTDPFTGGAADLTIDFTGVGTVNGYGMGVVSLTAGGGEIVLHATANGGAGSNSVTMTTTSSNCFNVACFNSNGVNPPMTVDAPLTELFANANIGSARGAAGYEENVPAGEHTYSFTVADSQRSTVAAAFLALAGGVTPVITDIEVTSGGDVVLTTDLAASGLITKKADSVEDTFIEVPSTVTGSNERTINATDVDVDGNGREFYVVE